jgi:HSP20 family molecular chaperone IbpA
MGNALTVRKSTSLFNELEKMHDRVMKRAFDIFNGSGGIFGKDLENWLAAERELIWKPAIELREEGAAFNLKIAVPGVDPGDLDIEVTPEHLVVKAETHHEHEKVKGEMHACEFESGHLFRSVQFPKRVNTEKVKAEFKNGVVTVTAEIAEEAGGRKVTVGAA